MNNPDAALVETLAAKVHAIWAHWQQYVHSQCTPTPDGDLLIPRELVQRWDDQIKRAYSELTEKEKDSDREFARELNDIFLDHFVRILIEEFKLPSSALQATIVPSQAPLALLHQETND